MSSVTALQKRYQRSQRAFDLASEHFAKSEQLPPDALGRITAKTALSAAKARMEALEEAIAVMELPIS